MIHQKLTFIDSFINLGLIKLEYLIFTNIVDEKETSLPWLISKAGPGLLSRVGMETVNHLGLLEHHPGIHVLRQTGLGASHV